MGFEIKLSDGCTHCLTSEGPCLRAQALRAFVELPSSSRRARGEGEIWIMNVFAVLGRGEGKEAAEARSSGSAADGFPLSDLGLCPAPPTPQGGCEQASPPPPFHKPTQTIITTSLKPTQIPHPHALRSTALSSQASPHTAQACKHILVPTPHTHTHTRTHTHFTVRNKHRPCRLWKAGGRGRWCFPSGSQN